MITPTIDIPAAIQRLREKSGSENVGIRGGFGLNKSVDESKGNMDIVGTATTNDLDSSREVVLPEGADLTYFIQNQNVFVDHCYDMASVVGKIRPNSLKMKVGADGRPNGWFVRTSMLRNTNQELVKSIIGMAREGGIGFSIGFHATEYGNPTPEESRRFPGAVSIIRKWRWMELSFTPFPCNVRCQAFEPEPEATADSQALYTLAAKSMERIGVSRWKRAETPDPKIVTPPLDTQPVTVVII